MRKRQFLLSAIAGIFCVIPLATAQEKDGQKETDKQTTQQQRQQVGPEYRVFSKDVGRWTAKVKMWSSPDEVTESEGVEINRMIGPYFLVTDFRGEVNGQRFLGHGVFSYDRQKKKYSGVWIDSMSPAVMKMVGEYDVEKDTFVYFGEVTNPDGQVQKFKNVTAYNDDGSRTLTMYMSQPESDQWMKILEIHYVKEPRRGRGERANPTTKEVVD